MSERYLGDGLYVSFDGYQLVLRAPRENGDHWVALEPHVYQALLAFVEEIKKHEARENIEGGAV